jgi:hypothetical protein
VLGLDNFPLSDADSYKPVPYNNPDPDYVQETLSPAVELRGHVQVSDRG